MKKGEGEILPSIRIGMGRVTTVGSDGLILADEASSASNLATNENSRDKAGRKYKQQFLNNTQHEIIATTFLPTTFLGEFSFRVMQYK